MSELATRTAGVQIQSVNDLARISEMFAASGYFSDAKDAAQAGVKILAGQGWGIAPFDAMTGIYIIQGRATIGAHLIAAKIKASGKYDYRVRTMTDKACEVEFFQAGQSIGVSAFTIEEARKAGTKNLDKFARNMLFARAMSNGYRWYTPDVFTGPVYTPEELGAQIDGEGNVVEVEQVARPALEQPQPEPEAVEEPQEPTEAPEGILGVDTKTIAASLKPLKLDPTQARALIAGIVDRDVESIKDLTRAEGAELAQWSTERFESELDLQRSGGELFAS